MRKYSLRKKNEILGGHVLSRLDNERSRPMRYRVPRKERYVSLYLYSGRPTLGP